MPLAMILGSLFISTLAGRAVLLPSALVVVVFVLEECLRLGARDQAALSPAGALLIDRVNAALLRHQTEQLFQSSQLQQQPEVDAEEDETKGCAARPLDVDECGRRLAVMFRALKPQARFSCSAVHAC